jgi:hypothetical protein
MLHPDRMMAVGRDGFDDLRHSRGQGACQPTWRQRVRKLSRLLPRSRHHRPIQDSSRRGRSAARRLGGIERLNRELLRGR